MTSCTKEKLQQEYHSMIKMKANIKHRQS